MLLVLPLLIGIAAVPLAGGRLSALLAVRFRRAELVVAALVVQVLVLAVVSGPATTWHHAGHLLSYVLVGAFVLCNRRLPFFGVLSGGGLMNAAAIFTNGGVMPARPDAVMSAGLLQSAEQFRNSTSVEEANLWFLGDVFAIPASWPLANVFSLGDVVLILGAVVMVHRVCRQPALVRETTSHAPAIA